MFKLTVKNIAILIVLVCSSLVFFLLVYLKVSQTLAPPIKALGVLAFFVILFLIVRLLLHWFLNERIRTLFKTISTEQNIDYKLAQLNFDKDVLTEVNTEIYNYKKELDKEISDLKTNENYRREFLGNVSHELRTPLFSLQGYIIALMDLGYTDNNLRIDYLKRAEKNIERLISLVEDLQSINKYEASEIVLNIEKNNIKDIIKHAVQELEQNFSEFNIKLEQKINANYLNVYCDTEKIHQVFINLLMNAVKYSNENNPKIIIHVLDMEDKLLIEIEDNGIGIAQQHLPRLFERFYRVDKHRARTQGGSGLGLSIVKHIIEAHNQKLHVRSTVNEGATFSFTLQKMNE